MKPKGNQKPSIKKVQTDNTKTKRKRTNNGRQK